MPLPGLGGPPLAETPHTGEQWKWGGGGLRQTKALQAPPPASLPSSRWYSYSLRGKAFSKGLALWGAGT